MNVTNIVIGGFLTVVFTGCTVSTWNETGHRHSESATYISGTYWNLAKTMNGNPAFESDLVCTPLKDVKRSLARDGLSFAAAGIDEEEFRAAVAKNACKLD
jgi:hypothetical protein